MPRREQFAAQVAQFERANPAIKIKSVEYQWTGPTFAAKLAAGTLPTVFEVPFTDARTLGDRGQLADLTARGEEPPVLRQVQPGSDRRGHDGEGQDRRPPQGRLRAGAALQPQALPTGGPRPEQAADGRGRSCRRYAKQIAERTGKAGYAEMAKADNTAGWILTTVVYSLGGRMEVGRGTNARATLNNPQAVTALEHAQEDALDRQLDGLELRLRLERHQPGLRRRQHRHVHQRVRRLHEPRPGEQHRPERLRARRRSRSRRSKNGRRARRRDAGRRAAERERGGEGRGREVDRLLLRAAARHQVAGDPQRAGRSWRTSSRSACLRCRSSTSSSTTSRTPGSSRTSTCRSTR